MATFKDREGDTWQVALTVGHLAPLREVCGLDLGAAVRSPESFGAIFDLEPAKLVAALWLVCEDQAVKRGVTPEAWAYRFDGDAVEGATVALADAVIGFFPRAEIARALRGSLRRLMETWDRQAVLRIESTWSASAGNSPASSGSTPGL